MVSLAEWNARPSGLHADESRKRDGQKTGCTLHRSAAEQAGSSQHGHTCLMMEVQAFPTSGGNGRCRRLRQDRPEGDAVGTPQKPVLSGERGRCSPENEEREYPGEGERWVRGHMQARFVRGSMDDPARDDRSLLFPIVWKQRRRSLH